MSDQKVLYVCFDLTGLVSSELTLLANGYDVTTVLGADGVIAYSACADCNLVVLGDGGGGDRDFVERWLKDNYPAIPVITFCDLHL